MVVAGPDVYSHHREDTERYILTNLNIVSSFLSGLLHQGGSSECHRLCQPQLHLAGCACRVACGYLLLVQGTAGCPSLLPWALQGKLCLGPGAAGGEGILEALRL